MSAPRICVVITEGDPEIINVAERLADLLEVRIDLIGGGWQAIVKRLSKPWIATCRIAAEGGSWGGSEAARIGVLLEAAGLGADMVDIELRTRSLNGIVKKIKDSSRCLISYHELHATPGSDEMRRIIQREREAGADICKLVTTARNFRDNLEVLKMNSLFPGETVALAMGPLGATSRILCPLSGGAFTYASIFEGKESAPGQISISDLRSLYGLLQNAC